MTGDGIKCPSFNRALSVTKENSACILAVVSSIQRSSAHVTFLFWTTPAERQFAWRQACIVIPLPLRINANPFVGKPKRQVTACRRYMTMLPTCIPSRSKASLAPIMLALTVEPNYQPAKLETWWQTRLALDFNVWPRTTCVPRRTCVPILLATSRRDVRDSPSARQLASRCVPGTAPMSAAGGPVGPEFDKRCPHLACFPG